MNAAARHRPQTLGLPARLPFGLRARRRGDRRHAHRARARRAGPALHGGGRLRESRALRRAHPSSRPADASRSCASARRAPGSSRRSAGTRRSTASPKRFSRPSASIGAGKRLALFLRGHDGPRDARRDRAPDPRQALLPLFTARSASASPGPAISPEPGRMSGVDPREMAKSDVVVIWGTNAVATQVNLMTHAIARAQGARREDRRHRHLRDRDDAAGRSRAAAEAGHGRRARLRGHARPLPRRPRRPRLYGALYRRARRARGASARRATPPGRAAITGPRASPRSRRSRRSSAGHKRTFFRLGYGFSRQRNGAANMHAALCIPAVTGAWAHEGGGALHSNSAVYKLDEDADRGPRRARRARAPARPVARRRRSSPASRRR